MIRSLLLTLILVGSSMNGRAEAFNYEARVNGMVCAFCAYSVGKKIGALPGVEAGSVDVDLASGRVGFKADQRISEQTLAAVFTGSGFTLDHLSESAAAPTGGRVDRELPLVLDMRLDSLDTDRFQTVFEALGNVADGNHSRLVIEAPGSLESDLLKPVLMGRQQVVNVSFKPSDQAAIRLRLYLR